MSIATTKHRPYRRRRWYAGAGGPPITVADVQLATAPGNRVQFRFSSLVTLSGANVPALTVAGNVPSSCVQLDGDLIEGTYGENINIFTGGESWSLATAPVGLDEAARVVVPESGTIPVGGGPPP